jgi:hypothetical protein
MEMFRQIDTGGGPSVNTPILLQKLIDNECSLGVEPDKIILEKIFQAESCLLEMQREMIEGLRDEPRCAAIQGLAGLTLKA